MKIERRIQLLEALRQVPTRKPILVFKRPEQTEDDAIREAGIDPATTTAILMVTVKLGQTYSPNRL
jgi:hypothetical protein